MDLGLVGLTLLVVLLVAIARLLWIARTTAAGRARWAGAVAAATAFAVHSGFDFVWHLPAVLLTVMVLVGTALPTPVAPVVATDPVRLNERSPHENETVK